MTNSLFVDTSGWMASLIAGDIYHRLAQQEMNQALRNRHVAIYTTDHVVAELVALMVGRRIPRAQILRHVNGIRISPRVQKLYTDSALFEEAWALLQSRADKDWSLVDAISICQMRRLGITEVLTNDHHFEQAGYTRLLK